MIREMMREEIPVCVDVIRKSFMTVADEFGLTEENAPLFVAFQFAMAGSLTSSIPSTD